MRQRKIAELEITRLSPDGEGEADAPKAHVPFTMPGDLVRAELFRKRGGVYSGKSLEILRPSKERIKPRCIHFGDCGGCLWQEMPYELQLIEKEREIHRLFAHLLTEKATVYPIIPTEEPWNFRNKMEFTFNQDLAGNRYLGLLRRAMKGRVVNIQECHLCKGWMVDALKAVRSWWDKEELQAYHRLKNVGHLRTLTLREGRMAILLVSDALKREQIESLKEALKPFVESLFLRIQQARPKMVTQFYEMQLFGPDHVQEKLGPYTFSISPTAFFQPNSRQAEKLYEKAIAHASLTKESVVYDLYCGTGTLSIFLGAQAKEVIGIELVPEAVLDAELNAKENGCSNVTFYQGDVAEVIRRGILPKPDVVFVDPPRAGLAPEMVSHLLQIRAKKLVYISCNPKTLAANLKELVAGGYQIESLQPVDQFPHSPHVEMIASCVMN